ncbi:ATP-binding Cassette (ABC) Superfamily [Trachipleistophora hominis]|uniref:ATP-binding Cassette (ABC) Superfamily n=1 Tax=Trachipleistophora hominis TaxID=72359 RepID=L7JUJ9_TRAHO|nr:ATP-binding Cassette (ABC) Superfamily [Trachipleistophora hominis]
MASITTYEILQIIMTKYVKDIPLIRMTIMPTLFLMFVARIMEVKVSEIVQNASLEFSGYREGGTFKKYMIVGILSSLLIELQGFIFKSSVQRAYRTALKSSLREYLLLNWSEFKMKGMGEITASIERRSSAVSEILDVFIINLLPVFFVLFLAVLKIYAIMGFTSSLIILISLITYTTVTIKMAVWRNEIRKKLNLSINESNNKLIDILSNYESILAFNNQNLELYKYDNKLATSEKHYVKLWRTFYLLNFLQRFVLCVQTGMIIYVGMCNKITSDQFVLYLSISKILASNLDKLGYMYSRFTAAILNAKMSFLDTVLPKKLYPIRYFDKKIVFRNVALPLSSENILNTSNDVFTYAISDNYIFKNMSFEIKKGEKIALIGPNGIGKSNFLKMLLKFNEYTGSIKIDDDELCTIDNYSLRDLISYVPQNSYLVSGTVKENIKYGNLVATDEEMIELCRSLNFHESFVRLSSGYETCIGENNSVLSGGEKQKVAIARAMLKNAEIYLFDEPTANLDKKSEETFFKRLAEDTQNKTVIVILHNLELLDYFDRIMFLQKDRIQEIKREEALKLMNSTKNEKSTKNAQEMCDTSEEQ